MRMWIVAVFTVGTAAACAGTGGNDAGVRRDCAGAVNVAATPPIADSLQAAADVQTVTVYKNPTCNCCSAWADHMRRAGFQVVTIDTTDLDAVKRRYGVANELAACHTAVVNGYVIEAHVPAADVRRLLAERPSITGLVVPGMPVGSPGMEVEGQPKQRYQVFAFSSGKRTTVFASH